MSGRPGSPPRLAERARTRWALAVAGLLLFAGAAGIFLVPFALPTPPPIITAFRGTQLFSPAAGGAQQATIAIRVRERSNLTLEIRSDEGAVRTLLDEEPLPAGWTSPRWDGRDDAGRIVPDGEYRIRLRARSQVNSGRVFNTSRRIRVDTEPPPVTGFGVRSAAPGSGPAQCRARVVAPGGDRVRFSARRNGRTIADGPTGPLDGDGRASWDWDGSNDAGEPVLPGIVEIRALVADPAGNRTRRAATCWVGHLTGRVRGPRPVPGSRIGVLLSRPDGSALPRDTPVALALYRRVGVPGRTAGGVLGQRVAGRARGPLGTVRLRLPRNPAPGRLWLIARTETGVALIDPVSR